MERKSQGCRYRGPRALSSRSLALLSGLLVLACTGLPRHPRPSDFEGVGKGFSGEIVEAHLAALWGLGERPPGSESDEIARAYLAREFRLSGAKVDRLDAGGGRENLIADLAGESRDVVLLVAAYPVSGLDSGVDETGAAVLLELARALGADEHPYGLRFALAETRPRSSGVDSAAPPATKTSAGAGGRPASERLVSFDEEGARRELLIEAGRRLARALEAEGQTERIRAVIVLDLSFHPNFVFTRDLRSHPGFREIFWSVAARLGLEEMFPPDADWTSPATLQLGFQERSMDRIVALVDVGPAPGLRGRPRTRDRGLSGRGSDRERTIRELAFLGEVIVDGLGKLMERLEKVDAFSR